MVEHRLRILHVSDLHVVVPGKDRDPCGRALVLGPEWEKNLAVIAAGGRIDLVCFTGDLAFSGSDAEYAALTPFVDALLARVKTVATDGRFEWSKSTQNYDGPYHRRQHGFAE